MFEMEKTVFCYRVRIGIKCVESLPMQLRDVVNDKVYMHFQSNVIIDAFMP